jgi:hypothetical protein
VTAFEPLAEFKTTIGVPSSIVTTEYIDASYTGVDQARVFLNFLTTDSESALIDHADDLLLFLNHLMDAGKKNPRLAAYIYSMEDIIHGLESNPEEILRQADVQARLRSFLSTLLNSGDK